MKEFQEYLKSFIPKESIEYLSKIIFEKIDL